MTNILKAAEFAVRAHMQQVRKGTDIPYVIHPLGVGRILAENKCPEECIIAGILHDTLEDTDVTYEVLKKEFGAEIANIVKGASEPDKSDSWENRKKHTIEYLKTAPENVRLVACADKLHNLQSILKDYHEEGEKLWDRFRRGKDEQLWYYTSLVEAFKTKRYEYPMFREFEAEVGLLKGLLSADKDGPKYKTVQLDLNRELEKYFDDSSLCANEKPKLVILMGGAGAGKTTIRKQKYSKGFVVIDAGEIFNNLGGTQYHEFGKDLEEPMDLIGRLILSKAIKEKRNMVTEMIGESEEPMRKVIDAVHSCGYQVSLQCIQCDPAEAYKRSLNKDMNDISAFYTQKYHQQWIIDVCKDNE